MDLGYIRSRVTSACDNCKLRKGVLYDVMASSLSPCMKRGLLTLVSEV